MSSERLFGHLADGRAVQALRLAAADGLEVEILTYGAIIRSLRVPARGQQKETVIGFDALDAYEGDRTYQGCIVGRTVNRMRSGRFERDGQIYQVTQNEGENHLHGGSLGLTRRIWQAGERIDDNDPVVLSYVSPAGEEGYPGILHATIRFSLPTPRSLEISYEADVDAPCPVDLTHHLYFNLGQDAGEDIRDHILGVSGDQIVEVDSASLAIGRLLSVDDTLFDLRAPRRLRDALSEIHPQLTAIGLNQSWVTNGRGDTVVSLFSPKTGLCMKLMSDQPCLQVWSGLSRDVTWAGAVALEPQGFTDAVNVRAFPSAWLEPGDRYRRTTTYSFEAV